MVKMLRIGPKVLDLRTAKPAPKEADPFYRTPEWAEARKRALLRGSYRCCICGARGVRLFVDHIVELKDGGEPFAEANLQVLCGSCHSEKTARARAQRMRASAGPAEPTSGGEAGASDQGAKV